MAQEREVFGFYFAAHPVAQYRAIASMNGARSHAALMESGPEGGSRQPAVMAALVEAVNRGKTRKGKDFVRADFSDASGQFSAACFEESLVEPFSRWAREGTCVLLNVELDRPSPDEPPRITVRGARPLDEVTGAARMALDLRVHNADAFNQLAALLPRGDGGTGEVFATVRTQTGDSATLLLGRDFLLDGEVVDALAMIDGVREPFLRTRSLARLRLVA